ncbi:MAG TPA: phosphoesterase, partial [Actinomycetota bacterium]|nr:phosphoesterase [Actinomycetota bacterium]
MLKLFFATDVHGSETTFRKWLNAAQHYGADVLVMGGDLTGKMLVPIVAETDGSHTARFEGSTVRMTTDEELANVEKGLRQRGYYTQRMTAEERSSYRTP